ncbi:nitrite reductase precursor [mine drainage metagenome]|uniref:Nitrite reductase n=1 Tax=mine drainage metagenome TaxID=410659 RepID=A0A1J5S0X8_9ZZZZ
MNKHAFLRGGLTAALLLLTACAGTPADSGGPGLRGTGALGIVIGRASGQVMVVDNDHRRALAMVDGLGDLSHASAVYSHDERYAYVAGRDGGLTKVDLLRGRIVKRILQAGNSIGLSISEDGRIIAVQNYKPGGVRFFDADTLAPLSSLVTHSRVVGLADAPGQRFVFSLFDTGEIWLADLTDPRHPKVTRFTDVGREPYDGLITPDGHYYIAGLFGEDGLDLLDMWHPERGVRRILDHYGEGHPPLPVYKMPHLRGWAQAGRQILVPAVGHHEVLVIDTDTWTEKARIPVAGQPVFVIARPDHRQVWVNFAFPDNGTLQVIDLESDTVIDTLHPGRAILHMEFTPRGDQVWVSARDDNKVLIFDTASRKVVGQLPMPSPSGIFFSDRAHKIGL